ncbi:MAG: NADH:flavin oxidoreductase/NADH oxidase [Campylobacteraceae bacterium]|jgi:NADPH2 dehydrogenase|nr:NADH:flavin oxidoreductase/NADH oxidase [Campylobacteraceae bacterium]
MSKIFTHSKIGNLELKNKIIMPPMCMYSADNGKANKFHEIHYGARAIGGVGLIIVEATAVEPRGRISEKDLGLWSDEQIKSHKQITDICHQFGSKIAVQLNHAGRKSKVASTIPIAPSALKFSNDKTYKEPAEIVTNEINEIKKLFTDAAKRAKEAGYDAVEIHAAHGFLLYEFLSPITNKREDEYGGSFDNRLRIVLEIVKKIKQEVDLPLIVRISADEWVDGGWSLQDSVYLSKELEKAGVDAIDVSAGGNNLLQPNMPKLIPFYQVGYAKEIKQNVKIPTIAVGLVTIPSEAEALLLGNVCDFVAVGRELIANPNFCLYAAKEFKEDIIPQYERGTF